MSPTNENRRAFLRGKISRHSATAIRPPWIISLSHFVEKCNQCNACLDVCSENILFSGDGGFPEVDFTRGECSFCGECTTICRQEVFQNLPRDSTNAWSVKARISSSCLSLNAILCRACGDNCPTEAIHFHLRPGGISVPELNPEICNGCGACLYVCPENAVTQSYSAE